MFLAIPDPGQTLTVEVRQEHINQATYKNCPIEYAIAYQLRIPLFCVSADYDFTVIKTPEILTKRYTFKMTSEAARFVERFDSRKRVQPELFVFERTR